MFRQRPPQRDNHEMVFGIRAILEALDADKELETVFLQKGLKGELLSELKKALWDRGLAFNEVPVEKLNRMTPKNHQGAIALISPITYQGIEEIVLATFEKGEVPLIVVLDRITDVRNYGAIARSAECMGAHAILVPQKGSAQTNADAIKASAGALFKIPVCRVKSLTETILFLQRSGIQVVACTEKAVQYPSQIDFTIPTAIVMGSEEDGLSKEMITSADELTRIPMLGTISSLNVSVATAITLYEVVRQRTS